MRKAINNIGRILIIIVGAILLFSAIVDYSNIFSSYSGSDAGKAGALMGTTLRSILALAMIVLPGVSLYRSQK